MVTIHSHPPNPCRIEAAQALTQMRERASSTDETTGAVISSGLQEVTSASQGALPRLSTVKRNIRRIRQKLEKSPPCPTSLITLNIPEIYRTYFPSTGLKEEFLLFDSGPTAERILVYGRPRAPTILNSSDVWFADGTFDIVPKLFYQLFVISSSRYGAVHPLLFALLPNKKKETYRTLFTALKEMGVEDAQFTLCCDYEIAIIKEFIKIFPTATIGGCLFHFSQNILKKVKKLGLMTEYENDTEFNLSVRMLMALAFVPTEDVALVFDDFQDSLSEHDQERLESVLDYLERNYIGRRLREGRGTPPFRLSWWNVYTRTLNRDPRTNNYSEAGHRKLQLEFGYSHPTLWRFIEKLKQCQKTRDVEYTQAEMAHEPTPKRPKYATIDNRIYGIVSKYGEEYTSLEYLRAIAHNLSR